MSKDAVTLVQAILRESSVAPYVTHEVLDDESLPLVTAIYGEDLPPRPLMAPSADLVSEVNKPATALVVKSSWGTRQLDGGLRKPRVLVRAYAPNLLMARELAELAADFLHDETFDVDGVRVELEVGAGPNASTESDSLFPYCDYVYSASIL